MFHTTKILKEKADYAQEKIEKLFAASAKLIFRIEGLEKQNKTLKEELSEIKQLLKYEKPLFYGAISYHYHPGQITFPCGTVRSLNKVSEHVEVEEVKPNKKTKK